MASILSSLRGSLCLGRASLVELIALACNEQMDVLCRRRLPEFACSVYCSSGAQWSISGYMLSMVSGMERRASFAEVRRELLNLGLYASFENFLAKGAWAKLLLMDDR